MSKKYWGHGFEYLSEKDEGPKLLTVTTGSGS
ncbi:hypothetical protein KS4_09970 [Poriferisphaera corsica]|uniref:Uncharacterized protein n=1 Tax=Poriferisphaera corsica TaxID=2528020 RepID=A0A517YRW5_9BACT|nr:hypothetical protein KS4_09970 [Poriferisphaera corsica]